MRSSPAITQPTIQQSSIPNDLDTQFREAELEEKRLANRERAIALRMSYIMLREKERELGISADDSIGFITDGFPTNLP